MNNPQELENEKGPAILRWLLKTPPQPKETDSKGKAKLNHKPKKEKAAD